MTQTILFFDLDETLMRNPFAKIVVPAVTQELMTKTGLEAHLIVNGLVDENERRQRELPPDDVSIMDWDDIAQWLAAQHGVTLETSAAALVEAHAAPPHTELLDEAVEVLRQLKAEGRKLVVSSKGLSKYQFPVMRALGLYDLFDDFLTPDLAGWLKTDPRYYSKYGESSGLWINIGDHLYDDIYCPMCFGHQAILVARVPEMASLSPFERPEHLLNYTDQLETYNADFFIPPDAVVVHLNELPEVIAAMERA
jgi:putative hydrolase of the HAD superfamily